MPWLTAPSVESYDKRGICKPCFGALVLDHFTVRPGPSPDVGEVARDAETV